MKTFASAVFCLLLLASVCGRGQSLSIFDLDESNFPLVKAKLYAFDAAGGQVSPLTSELNLTENGTPRTILSVTCPPIQPPRALSSVLVIDVSGSMAQGPSTANMDLAKSAARVWVNTLPLGQNECAVTSFDHLNYLNQDFTTDGARLLSAIDNLAPNGATDYDMGLLLPAAGGLQISKNGKHQKVIVFLTDGFPSRQPDVAAIVAEAQRQNCIIYAVTLNMLCPQSLQDISTQTGGHWFERVTTVQQAEDIYRQILHEARSGSPCEIQWRSVPCPAGYRDVELGWSAETARASYVVPASVAVSLDFSPASVFIRSKPTGVPFDTAITVTALNSAFTVTNVTSSNPAYDVNPKSFSLSQGGSTTLTVTYTPPDSGYTWTEFAFETDVCEQHFYAGGGFPGVPAKDLTLKVDHPNGAEVFVVQSDTTITWSGIPATDWVKLEYSTNNGLTWNTIEPRTRGGRYAWRVPKTPSTQCLVRATRLDESGTDASGLLHTLRPHGNNVQSVSWSPDGTRVATASIDQNARVWDAASGTLINTLSGHTSAVLDVEWSPDGTRLATASVDRTVKIWDAVSGAPIRTMSGHTNNIIWVRWSPDGTRLLTPSQDGTAKIWDAASGALLHTLNHTATVYDAKWSPDGTRVVTASGDMTAKIWNAATGTLVHTLAEHTDFIIQVNWSPDGTRVVTGCQDYTAKVWDAASGARVLTLSGHTFGVIGAAWSPDGTRIATASRDNTARIWNAATGASLHSLTGHAGWVSGVRWSPDGSLLATGSFDNTAKVWKASDGQLLQDFVGHTDLIYVLEWSPEGSRIATAGHDETGRIWYVHETPEQQDVSDAVFSIVEPQGTSLDVDMGKVLVGSTKDSVVAAFVANPNPYPLRIDSIKINGAGASRFSMVSGNPPFEIPANGAAPVEFSFSPTAVGNRSAQLVIYTQTSPLFQSISGEGIAPQIDVINNVIDFGQVDVGLDKDSIRAVTIRNAGTAPLDITATRHAGPNDVDFTTLAGSGPFTLRPGDTARLDLRFTPSGQGRTSGQLLFEYAGEGSPAVVQLAGEGISNVAPPVVLRNAIDFGKVAVGGNRDSLQAVTIANLGIVPVTITNTRHGGPNATDFTTLAGGGPFTLIPGDTARLDLRFSPSAVGPTNGTLLFEFDGEDSPISIQLLGEGVDVASAKLRAARVEAMAGDTIEVPILLEQALNVETSGATSFAVRLSFNATLLEPIDPTPGGIIVGDDRVIDLELPTTADQEGILMKLSFRAGLGNDSVTTLLLEEPASVGGTVAMTVEAGEFKLLGICSAGSARLLNPNGSIALKLANGNPVQNGSAEVELETIEIGRTSLALHDLSGRTTATYIDGEVEPGRRLLRLDLSNVPAGLYFLILATPTEMRTIPVQVAQ